MDGNPQDKPPEPISLPWVEPGYREFKDIFATTGIAVLLVVGFLNFVRAAIGAPGNQLASGLLAIGLAATVAMIWYGPMGWVGARVTVDERGLWVRHWGWNVGSRRLEFSVPKHLPADQLGSATVVNEDKHKQMWRQSMALSYQGKQLGWTRINVGRNTTAAVLIEQTGNNLKRPWWLLKCQAPAELVQAIDLCRHESSQ